VVATSFRRDGPNLVSLPTRSIANLFAGYCRHLNQRGHTRAAQAVADTTIPKLVEQEFEFGQIRRPLSSGVAR
jgi:hypothetical protein